MEDPWPLRHLVLRTPRLELRPDDDAGLIELAEVAAAGVHPPEQMPFRTPWTDADPRQLGLATMQYYWSQRARLAPHSWSLQFLVRHGGRVLGAQTVSATDFAVTREVQSGSWLGLPHQGRGIGTEMRAAVLMLAFDHLGAVAARSAAYVDNPASIRVSERLGYRPDGAAVHARRGQPVQEVRLLVERAAFARPGWAVEVAGLDGCRELLGVGPLSPG